MSAGNAKTIKIFSVIGGIATSVGGVTQWATLGSVGHAVIIGLGLVAGIAFGVAQVLGKEV